MNGYCGGRARGDRVGGRRSSFRVCSVYRTIDVVSRRRVRRDWRSICSRSARSRTEISRCITVSRASGLARSSRILVVSGRGHRRIHTRSRSASSRPDITSARSAARRHFVLVIKSTNTARIGGRARRSHTTSRGGGHRHRAGRCIARLNIISKTLSRVRVTARIRVSRGRIRSCRRIRVSCIRRSRIRSSRRRRESKISYACSHRRVVVWVTIVAGIEPAVAEPTRP